MGWWSGNRLRLIQNNLREVDADLDVDKLIDELQRFGANTLMMNAGGIFAFYPSKLEYQYVTPYLKKDLLGEAVEKAHRAGMRFIARFDFSKAHESIYAKRPEWFYRSREGKPVNYYGIMHTCLNGGYQQEYSMEIIGEVLDNYPVDGIFFNMFGYQFWDYSGNRYGICHCDSCKARFKAMKGLDLPEDESPDNPVMRIYRQFQEETQRDILEKIGKFVRSRRPDVAINTYHHHEVDLIRHESNTSLTRPHPRSPYSAAENVMPVFGSWKDKFISNCSINAVDLAWRFTAVSPEETAIRLYGNIANGSGLDFCIIGAFEGYTDTVNYDTVRRVFQFHKKHEELFGSFISVSDIILVKPDPHMTRDPHQAKGNEEYRGLFKMLKELHAVFDVVEQDRLAARLGELPARIVMLPGIEDLQEETLEALADWQRRGGSVIATGGALANRPDALERLFGSHKVYRLENTDAAYVEVDDAAMFPALAGRSWLVVTGTFTALETGDGHEQRLRLIHPSTFGPPERAYGHTPSEQFGLVIRPGAADKRADDLADGAKGAGASAHAGAGAYIGWGIGAYYFRQGFEDVKRVLDAVLDRLLGGRRTLRTDAHPSVEVTFYRLPDGSHLLQCINLTGFNGVTYLPPLPLRGLAFELAIPGGDALEAVELAGGGSLAVQRSEGRASLTLPELGEYAAIHIRPSTRN